MFIYILSVLLVMYPHRSLHKGWDPINRFNPSHFCGCPKPRLWFLSTFWRHFYNSSWI